MKEKKYNYVYITTNLKNGKQYVGDHSTNDLEDGYLGSGLYLQNSIKRNGAENFKKEILEFFDTKQEAFDAQEKWINEYNTLNPSGYNISPKGGHFSMGSMSESTKRKIGEKNKISLKGKKLSEEVKIKLRKPKSKEFKENLKKPLKYTWVFEEDNKISKRIKNSEVELFLLENKNWKRGRFISEKTKEKISKARKNQEPWNKGLILGARDEKTKEKIRKKLTGVKHTEERKLNISKSLKSLRNNDHTN